MRVELGANVRSSDGREIGHVHKAIVDTRRRSVSGLVLRQGGLLHKDIQVALTEVRTDPAEGLILTNSSDIIRDMPAYKPPGAGGAAAVERADVAVMLAQYEMEHAVIGSGSPVKGRDGRIWGIDHGLCFNVVPKLRTVIWDFVGQELPPELHGALCETYTDPVRSQTLRAELTDLLHPDEVEAFFVRLERVCERAEFPVLDPYRNVPRGFF